MIGTVLKFHSSLFCTHYINDSSFYSMIVCDEKTEHLLDEAVGCC